MKVTTRGLTLAVLGTGLVAGALVLAMWLPSGSDMGARASMPANGTPTPTPITVGIDMDTTGNSCPHNGTDCTLGTIDFCREIPAVGDGKVNDGCPADGAAETGANCDNATDDDADTVVNDGCPQFECEAEAGADCANDTDDDVDPCITIDVFLKDLPPAPEGTAGYAGFQYRLTEKDSLPVGAVAAFSHFDTLINLIAQGTSVSPQDFTSPVGTTIPFWDTIVADLGTAENNPPFTKGVMSRVQIDTTGIVNGVYNLVIPPSDAPDLENPLQVLDGNGDNYCAPLTFQGDPNPIYVGCDILDGNTTSPQPHGVIAKGVPCPTYADVSVTQEVKDEDCTSDPPDEIDADTDTVLCLVKTIVNNGPEDAVGGTITTGLDETDDCDITEDPTNLHTFAGLDSGANVEMHEKFTINCDEPSTHDFTFTNDVVPTAPAGVIDPDTTNNTDIETDISIDVIAESDVEIDSQAFVSPPTEITVGVDTTVTLRKHLLNNGTYGPVTVLVAGARTLPTPPPTCTAVLDDINPSNSVSLPVSVDTVVDEVWIVNCNAEDTGVTFTFHNSITITTAHVEDPGPGLNTADTDLVVDVVPLVGDVTCDGNAGTVTDAAFIFQYILGLRTGSNVCPLPANTLYLPGADVTGDTNVTITDAAFIFRCILGYHNVFCP